MCENDIAFAPKRPDVWPDPKLEGGMRSDAAIAQASADGTFRGNLLGDLSCHVLALLGRVRILEASRLTRKQLEDAAARLFVSPSGQDGYCLSLLNGKLQPIGYRMTRDDVAAILAEALIPKE